MAKKGLGKGLGALITKTPEAQASEGKDKVVEVAVDLVFPSPLQPRKTFNEDQLAELRDSIKEHGVIQPLIVRKSDDGRFELIAGERRWRASKLLNLATVPIYVREATDREMLEMALIENLQRADLDAIEEAAGYERLAREFGMKQAEIATRVGKSRATVANAMRLLNLVPSVQAYLSDKIISVGHAKALLALKDEEAQNALAETIIRKKLTVRASERMAQSLANSGGNSGEEAAAAKSGSRQKSTPVDEAVDPIIRHMESLLRNRLGTQVKIDHAEKKGKIELDYYGNDDLHRILELIGVEFE